MTITYIVSSKTLSKFKQKARELKKSAGIPHHEALEQVAKNIGLPNWHKMAKSAEITAQTESAFLSGLIVAFDIKDGGSFDPADTFVEDDQAIEFCEKDLVASYRQACEDEGEPATEEEVEEYRQFEVGNHVFFRYVGKDSPQNVREALNIINAQSFWPPLYVWWNGKYNETYNENATNDDGEVVGVRF